MGYHAYLYNIYHRENYLLSINYYYYILLSPAATPPHTVRYNE